MMRSSRATTTTTTLLALLVVALSAAAGIRADSTTVTATRDVDACRALGFDADALDCRRCDELASFLGDTLTSTDKKKSQASRGLDADCRNCCTDVSAAGHRGAGAQQYDRVVLEVCTCKFGRYPKVANFVHYHAEKHAKLEIKYINARHPFLVFYDAEGNKKEEIGISSWDEDTISEFIIAKIKKSDDETPAPAKEALSKEASDDIVQGETTANADADAESSISTTEETADVPEDMQISATQTENDEL